ncbi:MAG: hypothetical protein Q7T49_00210 [bacterium]|nr:hypothetical protein [bacterium]
MSDLWKDNGPMELITILTPGSSYEVISSGELEEGKYWLITRDQDGKVRALTSTEKLPATKKVVVMKEKNTFHLIPYEEPSTDPKGWGAEEAAAKTESEKASEPALPKP